MTIIYRLFNIPLTPKDFADKVSKQGHTKVTLSLVERNPEEGSVYICQGILEAGDMSLRLSPHFGFRGSEFGDFDSRIQVNQASRDALTDLLKATGHLEKSGLEYQFQGEYSADQVERVLRLTESEIGRLKKLKKSAIKVYGKNLS